MDLKLHANATTTPRTRAYIQQSAASNSALARELGIHSRTVARWKARQDVLDRSTCPHRLATTMTPCEETLVVELRRSLALPLDDICEAMRRCVNPQLSRSGIHRCLKRHGLSARFTPQKLPAAAFQTDAPAGFIHVDVKYLPPLNRRRSYAYVAIDRATRFVYLEILPNRLAETAAAFLERFLNRFPLTVHRILTDNGSEFTDRFAVDKKDKPHDKPSGAHPFDRACARHAIAHRLTRPFRPQTNGMVERFNRRLAEHLDRVPQNRAAHHRRFVDHAERDAYLHTFVADYNRTRLRSLDYHAPAELLAKLAGHNTKAGERAMRRRQLKWLWARLKQLSMMALSREELLMKLGAARAHAPAAWRLVVIAVAPEGVTFTYHLDRNRLRRARRREGRYLLRTNLTEDDPAKLWNLYLLLVRVEEAFKNLKGDLAIRPIFHQDQARIEAHIFIAFLAYCLHATLARRLHALAPGLSPRSVIEKFAAMQMIDVHVPTTDGRELLLTRYTEPDAELRLLLDKLKLALPAQSPPKITTAQIAPQPPP